jgi:hypothetical protein
MVLQAVNEISTNRRQAIDILGVAAMRRVGVWRGGFRWSMSVCRPFRLAVP